MRRLLQPGLSVIPSAGAGSRLPGTRLWEAEMLHFVLHDTRTVLPDLRRIVPGTSVGLTSEDHAVPLARQDSLLAMYCRRPTMPRDWWRRPGGTVLAWAGMAGDGVGLSTRRFEDALSKLRWHWARPGH